MYEELPFYCLSANDNHSKRLFETNPNCVRNVSHVLVDEFQDTNTIQYEIVKHMARQSGALTIVGDPDQSIYAWRSAEVENLSFMLNGKITVICVGTSVDASTDFKPTHQVFLEENYRSTSSILAAALAVVQQGTLRLLAYREGPG
jgi:DNA helicase-2/ATP-dependent DNA helicase PcrA